MVAGILAKIQEYEAQIDGASNQNEWVVVFSNKNLDYFKRNNIEYIIEIDTVKDGCYCDLIKAISEIGLVITIQPNPTTIFLYKTIY